jgi:hypothetical protein
MLDDLREQADDADFFAEEESGGFSYTEMQASREPQFLGMTPLQRFVIALMILMMTCILGLFFLLVTEKIAIPFLI